MRINSLFRFTILVALSINAHATAQSNSVLSEQYGGIKLHIGRFESRALWNPVKGERRRPVVIMIPGSGANGPEESMDGNSTSDGKPHSVFIPIANSLNAANVNTLALGKPGVEFETGNPHSIFYNQSLYSRLQWFQLLQNLKDAVEFAVRQPNVDPQRIYILGHSEGTQVAVDYAATDGRVRGLILLGYVGNNMAETLDWQLSRRPIESFIAIDVDKNKDGWITREEDEKNREFRWDWTSGINRISLKEIENTLRAKESNRELFKYLRSSPLYSNGVWDRPPMYAKTANLKQSLLIINGALDLQTPPIEALRVGEICNNMRRSDCRVVIFPGVGHAFSVPKPPRSHPFLDMTLGPVIPEFLNFMRDVGSRL